MTKETYTYDGEGNRLTKEETAGTTGRKTCYVTDNRTGYTQTVLELDEEKKIQAAYERGDALLTVRTEEGTKTYITDGHGDVRYLTDEDGHVTDSYRYTAYGELAEKSGNTKNPYLYCGEYYDEGTGLYYLRARYMRPTTGTFISMDTYQGNAYDPASLHKYTYAQNNPQMYNDPSGHFIAAVQMCMNSAFNSYLRNYHALNVMGMISGVMNATVNHLLGGEDDLMGAYIKGYIAGFGFGAVYYGACAIAAIYEVTVLVHMGMFFLLSGTSLNELTFALCAGAVGNNKAALVHTVLAVLSIGGAMWQLNLSGVISVTGPKGTVEVDIKGKANKGGFKTDTISGLPENQGYGSFKELKNEIGTAGKGNDWHHIVEQSQINKSGFASEQIHNTSNIVAIDHSTHMKITGYYNTKSFDFTNGLSVRDWLAGQSYETQYEFGINILRIFGVIQ